MRIERDIINKFKSWKNADLNIMLAEASESSPTNPGI